MDNNPLVSIIVPVYKVEKYLDECIESLVNQTYRNIDIILIDDGSPDNCPAICDAWAEKDQRIKVIHKENGGVSSARNAGIGAASGEWLLFVDSDDVISLNMVQALLNACTDRKRLVVSSVERFMHQIDPSERTPVQVQNCGKDIASVRGGLYCWGVLYNRLLVNNIDLHFDISLRNIEDVVWNSIYLRYISEVVYVDVPYFYRMNPTSITSKCSDYKWQVASWIAARRSIMNWFAGKPLTVQQRREVCGTFRYCQNNIHAECVAGGITYTQLHNLEQVPSTSFDLSHVPVPEQFLRACFPKLYFVIYTLLLRIKNTIRK